MIQDPGRGPTVPFFGDSSDRGPAVQNVPGRGQDSILAVSHQHVGAFGTGDGPLGIVSEQQFPELRSKKPTPKASVQVLGAWLQTVGFSVTGNC